MTTDPPIGPDPSRHRHDEVILSAEPARPRQPSATVWQLRTYDPATETATGDFGRRWYPAAPRLDGTVPPPVVDWVTTVLGPDLAISVPATYAGPHTWRIHPADSNPPDEPGGS